MLVLFFFAPLAFSAPAGLTFQGRLVNNDVAVESASVSLTVQVRSPATDSCLLYEETHTLNMTGSDGIFTIKIGGGTRTVNDMALTLVQVFSNTGTAINGLTCTSGATTYTSASSDTRSIYVSFVDNGTTVNFTSPYIIQSVPYAIEAERLAGKSSTDFLQVTANTTQSKVNALMVPATYTELLALLTGASTQYMTSSATNGTSMPVLSSAPSSPSAGTMWYEGGVLKYYDGVSSSVKTLGTSSGITADTVAKGGQAGALSLGTSDANDLTLKTNGTAKMTILSNGNVGIGTATPISALHVVGSAYLTGSINANAIQNGVNSNNSRMQLVSSGTMIDRNIADASPALTVQQIHASSTGDILQLKNSASTVMTVQQSGNVGIGTTAPLSRLNVLFANGSLGNDVRTRGILSEYYGAGPYSGKGGIAMVAGGTKASPTGVAANDLASLAQPLFYDGTTWRVGSRIDSYVASATNATNVASGLTFNVGTATGDAVSGQFTGITEAMRILPSGYVGIGTTNPLSPLQVNGAARLDGLLIQAATHAMANSFSIGGGSVSGTAATAIGTGATAASGATSLGEASAASGGNSLALGRQSATSTGTGAIAIGHSASATGNAAIALGYGSISTAKKLAIGHTTDPNLAIADSYIGSGITSATPQDHTIHASGGVGTDIPGANMTIAGGTGTGAGAGGFVSFKTAPAGSPGAVVGTLQERMRISGAGSVGIGTTAPQSLLHVEGTGTTTGLILNDSSNSQIPFVSFQQNGTEKAKIVGGIGLVSRMDFYTGGTHRMIINSVGNVGIGTAVPGYKLDVQGGDINASGSVRAAGVALTSDIRYKRDIEPLDNALEKILNIRGVSYNWRAEEFPNKHFNDRHQVGVIAQEVEKQFPEVVDTNKDGYKSVNYPALVAPLIEAVKTLYARLTGVEDTQIKQAREIASKADQTEIDALRAETTALRAEIKIKDQKVKDLEQQSRKQQLETKARLEKIERMLQSK